MVFSKIKKRFCKFLRSNFYLILILLPKNLGCTLKIISTKTFTLAKYSFNLTFKAYLPEIPFALKPFALKLKCSDK